MGFHTTFPSSIHTTFPSSIHTPRLFSRTTPSMASDTITLFCLISGEPLLTTFPVEVSSSKTVGDLKKAIIGESPGAFENIDAKDLVLWQATVPPDKNAGPERIITVDGLDDKTRLGYPRTSLSKLFPESLDDNTYIMVERPIARKRDWEEDTGSSSKRARFGTGGLMYAIEAAGLTEKAVVNGKCDLSRLDNKERVSLVGFIGQEVNRTDRYQTLSEVAFGLRDANVKDMDKFSALESDTALPVVNTPDLYIRQTFKDLYKTVLERFEKPGPYDPSSQNQIVVTGTSGIGKSAFLVYLAIRLLAERDKDPPLIIFQTKRDEKCYIFGGCSIIRSGKIDDFEPFLTLHDTWYLVDSAPGPVLGPAKTIISASPKTLSEDINKYKDVEKTVTWIYYMAPWDLEELKTCWNEVTDFQVVPMELVKELYMEIGGVPRYVLERPMRVIKSRPNHPNLKPAKAAGRALVDKALRSVDNPVALMDCFQRGQDSSEFSSRLVHRWPVDEDHSEYRLEWASAIVRDSISAQLSDIACAQILQKLIEDPKGSASGIMFEAYVIRTFRNGGYTFELRDLQTGKSDCRLVVPQNPKVERFHTIALTEADKLWIPKIRNFACVDRLLSHKDMLQITVSETHPIKGPPLLKLIQSLVQHGWIAKPEEARLIFVVPSYAYDNFRKQKYLSSAQKVYAKDSVPEDIKSVKQYVLKIDVEAAANGKSLGLETPVSSVRRNTPRSKKYKK